jgi:F-type H+-transporting ATPase subunit epsilon
MAMADTFVFELVSPSSKLIEKPVTQVTMPGAEGDFGVLAGHTLLMAALRPGVIAVYDGQTITDRVFVAGGFADVSPTRCTVLAQGAVRIEDLSRIDIEAEIQRLTTQLLAASEDEAERERILAQRDILLAQREALSPVRA